MTLLLTNDIVAAIAGHDASEEPVGGRSAVAAGTLDRGDRCTVTCACKERGHGGDWHACQQCLWTDVSPNVFAVGANGTPAAAEKDPATPPPEPDPNEQNGDKPGTDPGDKTGEDDMNKEDQNGSSPDDEDE